MALTKATGIEGAIACLKQQNHNVKHMARKRLRKRESYRSLDADVKRNREKQLIENYENNLNRKILKATHVWRSFTQKNMMKIVMRSGNPI
jgi:hypothetical protein